MAGGQAPALLGHGGPRFGKAPPLGISRPPSLSAQGDLKRSLSTGVAVKKEWNESNWKVTELERVPLDFPLERTHREIIGADAGEVANRISKTLRLLSVDAEYDGEKAKAKCTTSDMVSFRIRLYAGGEHGLPVVVEVQKRSGSPTSFMRVCRHILNGAEGADVKPDEVPARKKVPSFLKKGPISGMKCLQGVNMQRDPYTEMKGGIAKSMELIRSDKKDSNVLGLENLCLLTDPLKTRPDTAMAACKEVLTGDVRTEMREELLVMLQKDAFLPEEFDDDEAMRNPVETIRRLALVLLSNSLVLASKDGCLAVAVATDKWFAEFLIPTLLDEVKSFETSANNSYEAACGLTSLASCSDDAKRLMEENAAVEDLQAAHQYGVYNHDLLANEAERCLVALGKSVDAI